MVRISSKKDDNCLFKSTSTLIIVLIRKINKKSMYINTSRIMSINIYNCN